MSNNDYQSVLEWIKRTPYSVIIKTMFGSWYLLIGVPSIAIFYMAYKKLDELGIINKIKFAVTKSLETYQNVVEICLPSILNLKEFIDCVYKQ